MGGRAALQARRPPCSRVQHASSQPAPTPCRRDDDTGFPYVYTAPRKGTALRDTDQVYVIASAADLPIA